jgi:hypothetical protein
MNRRTEVKGVGFFRRARRLALASFGAFLGLAGVVAGFSLVSTAASARPVTLTYVGYLAGVPVLDLTATVDVPVAGSGAVTTPGDGAYQVNAAMGSSGNFAVLYPYRANMHAIGRLAAARPTPRQFQSDQTIFQKRETVTLAYGTAGDVTVTANPLTKAAQQAVTQGYANSTLDPASAIVALVGAFSQRHSCGGKYAVFDGARRYDIMVEQTGQATVSRLQQSFYQGAATECRATPTLVGGFQQAAVQSQLYPQSARLWLARPIKNFPAVPVRMAAQNAFGEMVLDLVNAQ